MLAGKKSVVFAVPGAFTPTCSEQHLPSFVKLNEVLFSVLSTASLPSPPCLVLVQHGTYRPRAQGKHFSMTFHEGVDTSADACFGGYRAF
jgi:hypothetical protein